MNLLGVDFGLKKVGIAVSQDFLAEPVMVIRYQSIGYLTKKINELIEEYNIDKIIVGVSEGTIGEETKKFIEELKANTNLEIIGTDESLSTQDAHSIAKLSSMSRKKRKTMEDAYAACLMLQQYIDLH